MDDDQRLKLLIENTSEAAKLLQAFGFDSWASWLQTDLLRILRFDVSGLDHLLSAFGGMGSINDVLLVTGDAAADVNMQLRHHLSEIFKLASSLLPDAGDHVSS